MKGKMKKEPAIRFKGYTDAWEQRKLGEMSKMYQPSTITGTELTDNGYPVFGANGYIGYYHRYNHDDDQVTISARGEGTGTPSYVSGPAWITGNSMVINVNEYEIDKSFLFSSLLSNSLKKYVTGGAQPQLTREILVKVPIRIPSSDEQIQIGTFFSTLDHLITLQQRELDLMKRAKKTLLSKMFPKNGELFPELRFKGYTDAWEQRKLGEVFEEYSEKNHEELPALTIMQGSGTVIRDESDRAIQYNKTSLSNYKMVKKDDFIMHLRSFEGGLEKATCNGIISPAYHTFHGNEADSRFYYAFFRSYDFIKRKLVPHIYGIRDGKTIDVKGLKSILIPYPSYDEQKKTGDFLEQIDHLITLQQRQQDLMKTLKKTLLKEMFI